MSKVLEPPEFVKILFDQYSQNGTMSRDHLLGFLVEFQGEQDVTNARAIFNSLKHLNIFSRRGLHLEAFFRYLLGELNGPLSLSRGVQDDMTAPLTHYFLYTGNKSYLNENQFSSVEPIIKALRSGVRVIDLDLWPSSTNDKVQVCYGRKLTNSVDLLKCLHAIKDNAFQASKYPVVITFEEQYLPANLQAKVAEMVTKTFGDMLYRPKTDQLQEFPSPESLKKRVMISTKPPKEYLETYNKDDGKHLQDKDEEMAVPEYRHLISIHAGEPKGALQELENAIQRHGTDIVRFTQRNLLRVYPKDTRIDSTNYNPFVWWTHGAQMVAFNMQGYGEHLLVMKGMFRANGGCGYVKKPDFLLSNLDHSEPLPVKKILKVTIYMGECWDLNFRRIHFDTYSAPDFFVEVGIAGVPADKAMYKTKAIERNWSEKFEFKLTVPKLAVLRMTLVLQYNSKYGKHDFRGQTCLPTSELRTGIRAIPLHDPKGDKYKNIKLFVRFEID